MILIGRGELRRESVQFLEEIHFRLYPISAKPERYGRIWAPFAMSLKKNFD